MGYVAVRGGQEAIEESQVLLEWQRVRTTKSVDIETIQAVFPDLIDQVMGESSLYAPELAALALKQAQGSPEEAVFLLRAFRSTLERPYVSRTVETRFMRVDRRISAAFKDVPGGQILGATRDYSHRLIDFNLREEDCDALREAKKRLKHTWKKQALEEVELASVRREDAAGNSGSLPKVADYVRSEGLLATYACDDTEPVDVTMEPLVFPAPRSARLQTLARGMTQAVSALGYAAIRGFGPAHPTVGELRHGLVEITLDSPLGAESPEEAYYVGSMPVTEVESLFESHEKKGDGTEELSFDVGYGMVIGSAETKAIAMSVLDYGLTQGDKRFPTQDEEFVLYHVDGIEATGFISHLKLPHYVTFQSKLSSVRKTREPASAVVQSDAGEAVPAASGNASATFGDVPAAEADNDNPLEKPAARAADDAR